MKKIGSRKKAKQKKRTGGSRIRILIPLLLVLAALFAAYLAQNQAKPEYEEAGFCSDSGGNCNMGGAASKGMQKIQKNMAGNASGSALPQNGQGSLGSSQASLQNKSRDQLLFEEINPPQGIVLAGRWLDLGPKIMQSGALNISAATAALRRNGYPITNTQLGILANSSNSPIIMDRNNSLFLLYAFWAFGLANNNSILENGPMSENKSFIPYYASTGAWTLGSKSGGELFSGSSLIALDSSQQALVEEIAYSTYRPCCNNPTAFPDCNHGMAALGLAEWLAYQNASKEEIYSALLAANSYWFPENYLSLAVYFNETGTSWSSISAKEILSRQYSGASGYSATRKQIKKLPGTVIIPGCCGA